MNFSVSTKFKARLFDPNLVFSLLTQIVNKAPALITAMILTRIYSTEVMGGFFFATAFSFFVSLIASFGTNIHLVRAVAAEPGRGLEQLGEVLGLRIPLSIAAFIIINSTTMAFAPELVVVTCLTSLHFLLGDLSQSFGAFLIGLRRFRLRFFLALTGPLFLVVSVFVAVFLQATLNQVLICYVLASLSMLAVSAVTVHRGFGPFPLPFHGLVLQRVANLCWPFFVLDALQVAQFKVDTLMIFWMVSAAAVAEYETAYRLLEVIQMVVRPLITVAFPLCVTLATQQRWKEVNWVLQKTVFVAAFLGFALMAIVVPRPEMIMGMIWGDEYSQSGVVLRVLCYTAPLLLVSVVCVGLANAIHLERTVLVIMGIALVVNLSLNVWAIPVWGTIGAAWTTFVTQAFIVMSILVAWYRKISLSAIRAKRISDVMEPL